MQDLIQMTFDYSLVDEDQARQLQAIYNRVLARHMATNYEDGKDLTEAENIQGLPYERFIAWAHSVFGWSETTINSKKNAYRYWGDFTPRGGVIDDHAMYLLSTKRVPETAREEAKERLNAGETITEDIAKQIRDAHKAKEEAEKAERKTRADLTRQIEALQQEMEALTTPEVEIKEVARPEDRAQIDNLQKKVKELTEQRDNLSKEAKKLGTIAKEAALREETRVNEERIRKQWRTACINFNQSVLKTLSQWPMPIDTQVFEADDWNYLSQAKETARRFLEECNNLSGKSYGTIIDAMEA